MSISLPCVVPSRLCAARAPGVFPLLNPARPPPLPFFFLAQQFLYVNLLSDGGPPLPRTHAEIVALFAEFDPARTGKVPLTTVLHVLSGVSTETSLSLDEVRELLRLTGILNSSTAKDPRALYSMEVDYAEFVKHLEFTPARK